MGAQTPTLAALPWPVAVGIGLAGLACGIAIRAWLVRLTYRRPDERDRPAPGPRLWVPPVTALAWPVLWWGPLDRGAGAAAGPLVHVVLLGAAAALVALAAIDLDVHRLPDRLLLPTTLLAALGLGVQALLDPATAGAFLRALTAGAVVGVGHLALALLTAHRGGLGLGDVKLAALLGLLLGWWGWGAVLGGVLAGALVGGVTAGVLLLTRRARLDTALAYGPALALGALLGLLGPHDLGVLLLG